MKLLRFVSELTPFCSDKRLSVVVSHISQTIIFLRDIAHIVHFNFFYTINWLNLLKKSIMGRMGSCHTAFTLLMS